MRKTALFTVPFLAILLGFDPAHAQAPSAGGVCRGGAGYTDATTWQFVAGDSLPAGITDGGCSGVVASAVANISNDPVGPIGDVTGSGGQLTATGDFKCGAGSLSGNGTIGFMSGAVSFNWSADFANGVGNFTTTTSDGQTLTATLLIIDGTPVACNDQFTTTPNPLPVGGNTVTEPPLGILIFTLG